MDLEKGKTKITSKGDLMPDSKEKRKTSHIQRGINARFHRKEEKYHIQRRMNARFQGKEELMPDSKEKKSHQRKEALLPDT